MSAETETSAASPRASAAASTPGASAAPLSRRRAGVLLHPTSLAGPPGIGDLGPAAHHFLDRLRASEQRLWQVLPLGPTGYGDSPYQSPSAFAGNPLLVSPERVVEDGLVDAEAVRRIPAAAAGRVDFGAVIPAKRALLAAAHDALRAGRGTPDVRTGFDEFRERAKGWLDDYALFAAIHDERNESWTAWPEELRDREPAALARERARLGDEIQRIAFAQCLFFRQWEALRRRAAELDIALFGDLPIFAAHDSVDVWTNRHLFDLDAQGRPLHLSGAPPDQFTDDGQLWGNPLYRWDVLRERGFDWWIERMRATLRLFDLIRVDHFRGLAANWAVPAGETTAKNGKWEPVPGRELFAALAAAFGTLPVVAEDLGDITPDVVAMRKDLGFPGMKVLLFGFSGDPRTNEYAPFAHERNFVVYTGTHDNETVQGWFREGIWALERPREEAEDEQRRVLAITGGDETTVHWDFVRLAMNSPAEIAIVPVQDLLGLGNEARMNVPGRESGNWSWRMRDWDWTDDLGVRLAELTRATGRAR
ncbi:MAG: 4-alpha-glucanotransferase [bacterium]